MYDCVRIINIYAYAKKLDIMCFTQQKVLPFCSYKFLPVRIQLLKIFPEAFGQLALSLGNRCFFNFRCTPEMASYVKVFTWHCNTCNIYVGDCFRRWKNLTSSSKVLYVNQCLDCSSNAFSVFDESGGRLFSDMHYLGKQALQTYLFLTISNVIWAITLPYNGSLTFIPG